MQARAFLIRADEHAVGKVNAHHARPISAVNRNRQVTRSTTKIEYTSISVKKNRPKMSCSAGAPEAIDLQGQQMVQQVVARGDLGEHLAHFFGSIGFGNGALRATSLNRRGGLSHGGLVNAWHWR